MRQPVLHCAVAVALSLGSVACPPGERARSGATTPVTDDAGRTVRVAVPAARIVSLAPSITELLFALGAGERVVGRTTWCKFPPAALTVPSVGDGLNPSVEAVAARRPDLVLLYRSPHTETAAAQLAALGIPSLILRHDRLEDVARSARLLGGITGTAAAAESIAAALDALLEAPTPPTAGGARVAFVVWDTPPVVIGGGSYLDQLARLAGAVNVFADLPRASITVSLETIVARNPDWLLSVSDSDRAEPQWASRPEWRVVPAVAARRWLVLPADLFGRPSPSAPRAVVELRRRLAARPGTGTR
jgi:ABC-type Fe3+-hydroxamate transport system substrate-binding protein